MRFLIVADIDDLHWRGGAGEADAVLSCGDVADAVLLEAAEAFGCSRILAVKGNHDVFAPFPPPIVDVHLNPQTVNGLTIGGFNGCWQYKPRGHYLYYQEEVEHSLAALPRVDIFLAHNSPRGVHDREDEVHVGFDAFNTYMARVRPRILLHGHQHQAIETRVGETRVIGVRGHALIAVDA
jgi:Icc-related predicted phosphoesterase